MKILFVWTPFFICKKKAKKDEFMVNFDSFAYIPSMLNINFDKTDQSCLKKIYKFHSYLYHDLNDKINDKTVYKFSKHCNFFTQIKKYVKIVSDEIDQKIKELGLQKYYKDVEYKIPFSIIGNGYVESVFTETQLKSSILINDPTKGEPFGHKIPILEKFAKEINSTHTNIEVFFDFSQFLVGKLSTSGGKVFIFDPYIESLKNFNISITKAFQKIDTISKPNKITERKLFAYYFIPLWLTSIRGNIEDFLVVHKTLVNEIDSYIKGSKNEILINSHTKIFSSMIYEFLKPFNRDSDTKSIVNFIRGMKDMLPKEIDFVKQIDMLDYDIKDVTNSDGQKNKIRIFKNKFINSWVKTLHDIRNKTYHPDFKNDELGYEHNYLMAYIELDQRNKDNINNTICFINESKDFIVNLYFLVWKIFNYLTNNGIYAKASDVKKYLLDKIK